MIWSGKILTRKAGIEPGSATLKLDTLTTKPTRWSAEERNPLDQGKNDRTEVSPMEGGMFPMPEGPVRAEILTK